MELKGNRQGFVIGFCAFDRKGDIKKKVDMLFFMEKGF